MFADKQQVLAYAPTALNRQDQPWYVAIEGDSIVARWKWMDAAWFAPHEVSQETRDYTFTLTLDEKGKWRETDHTENKSSHVQMGGGGVRFGSSMSGFSGKTTQKSFQFGVGKNNQTGQTGLISFKFDTNAVKQPIRDYLQYYGWKKA